MDAKWVASRSPEKTVRRRAFQPPVPHWVELTLAVMDGNLVPFAPDCTSEYRLPVNGVRMGVSPLTKKNGSWSWRLKQQSGVQTWPGISLNPDVSFLRFVPRICISEVDDILTIVAPDGAGLGPQKL
jgi:hypothetical protein